MTPQLPEDGEKSTLKLRIAELKDARESLQREHSTALLKAQEETHKVLVLLKEQMKLSSRGVPVWSLACKVT